MSGLRYLTAGESHGPALVAIVEGMPAGVPLAPRDIDAQLARRQVGYGRGGRMRIEQDAVEILGGVLDGKTTGAPISLLIHNHDWENWKGRGLPRLPVPRPGHADFAGYLKYELDDCRPVLERASARETAARVAAGAVARRLLAEVGVSVGSYVQSIGNVGMPDLDPGVRLAEAAESSDVRCPDPATATLMRQAVDEARERGESLGGVFVVVAEDVPAGLGSHVQWDRRLDGLLAQAVMSIPAIKGVEIGPAFENARLPGTKVQDAFMASPDAPVTFTGDAGHLRLSDRSGGLEGGMTTGQLLVLRAAMKPIPTTVAAQQSLDLTSGSPALTQYQRSDVCAVPAASVVAEAMVALVLAGALLEKFGGDSLAAIQAALERYRGLPLFGRGSGGVSK